MSAGAATEHDQVREPREATRGASPHGGADEQPLASYVAFATVFVSAFGGLLLAARRRLPERFAECDLVLLAFATHKLSRLISRDRVTRPLRAPFTEVRGEDPPLELSERPTGSGARRALGELLSCPYCLDQWIAAGFIGAMLLAPRPTRAVASMFAVVAGSDYLQQLQRWARDHA
jgi:Protein of unknown function (DUF1360)